MPPIRIAAAGDAALLVSLPQVIDATINAWCVAFAALVVERYGAAVRDAVVGYASVTVYFDPLLVDPAWLERELGERAAEMAEAPVLSGATVDVPVLYGGEMGPDIEDVARFAGCGAGDVIAWHAAVAYRVYLVGFVPGFAYLATVDPRIAAPRRRSPRVAVPPGSVAIAGGQTGIYPYATPGGWNIVGRTPLLPFDPARDPPCLFKPGDIVRFHPMTEAEFAAWQSVVEVPRRIETGEAPGDQGARRENIGNIRPTSNAERRDASPVECSGTSTTGCWPAGSVR